MRYLQSPSTSTKAAGCQNGLMKIKFTYDVLHYYFCLSFFYLKIPYVEPIC